MHKFISPLIAVPLLAFCSLVLSDDLPATTHDGLELLPDTTVRAAYMKPGADLSQYDRIALLEVYVAFRKNWQRDHNRDAIGLDDRVSDKDMQRIRETLAADFKKIFIDELSTRGGHEVVDQAGEGVLIVRPAIINLDVAAPDTMSPGMSRTYTASAGSMTLYMELYDGRTQDIIARVIDPEAVDDGMIQWSNSVSNRAEADRILRRWAKLLNEHLAEVKSVGR